MVDPATAAGFAALKCLITDLYKSGSKALKENTKFYNDNKKIKNLFNEINSIRNVKTIWQYEKAVDLYEFYYPTSISFDNSETKEVNTVDDFNLSGNILLQGIVGQGKSMFLRFLCCQELLRGKRIPLFIELRRISDKKELADLIFGQLKVIGFNLNPKEFEELAKNGKVILFLDGLDEAPESCKSNLASDIETLAETFSKLQIIMTSRPNSTLDYSTSFYLTRLAPLKPTDLRAIIYRLTNASALGEEIVKGIQDSPFEVRGIFTTPLMVTLLVLKYKADVEIPKSISNFYEDLFGVLFYRHDKTKSNFKREKKSGLNDSRIRRAFDTLCFLMRYDNVSDTGRTELLEYCEKALDISGEDAEEVYFLEDITNVTNLILSEGNRYYFLHKSVQEFHSASHVKRSQDPEFSQKFYNAMVLGEWNYWREELKFLKEIDTYWYNKYFFIPGCRLFFEKYLKRVPRSWKSTPRSVLKRLLSGYTINITVSIPNTNYLRIPKEYKLKYTTMRDLEELGWVHFTYLVRNIKEILDTAIDESRSILISSTIRTDSEPRSYRSFTFTGDKFIEYLGVEKFDLSTLRLNLKLTGSIQRLLRDYEKALNDVKTEEQKKSTLTF